MKKVWKEVRFSSDEDFARMASVLYHQRGFPPGTRWRFEDGPNILVTNLSAQALRRLARLDDIRLPEYVTLPADDPMVLEVIQER
jgi:hypothetical protein